MNQNLEALKTLILSLEKVRSLEDLRTVLGTSLLLLIKIENEQNRETSAMMTGQEQVLKTYEQTKEEKKTIERITSDIESLVKPLIPPPIKGKKGDKGERGERGERGADGINGENGLDGKDGKDGRDGINTDILPTQIVEKLESLKADERLDKSAIKGLEEELKKLRKELGGGLGSRIFGSRRVLQPHIDRFTSQTDGVTKTFYLTREPLKTDTIEVNGTDFPIILDPTVDFTVTGKTLTLSAGVPAPSQGATLICKYYA